MRKRIWLFTITAVAVLLVPGSAGAKGSTLLFEDELGYAPGERAVAHALVETWPSSGQPDDGPYTVYLVRGGQPLWFGHLPTGSIPVGELRIGRQVPDKTEVGNTYRVTAAFDVPQVSSGRYAVWVCRKKCGANSGFGDLVYGQLRVVPGTAGSPTKEPDAEAVDAENDAEGAAEGGTFPWAGLALAGIAVAALTVLLVRLQHRRASA